MKLMRGNVQASGEWVTLQKYEAHVIQYTHMNRMRSNENECGECYPMQTYETIQKYNEKNELKCRQTNEDGEEKMKMIRDKVEECR